MRELSDCVLIKVFIKLELKSLVRCCFVCSRWKRIIYDSSLWIDVDLRPFRWKLDEQSVVRLIQTRFHPCLKSMNLSGFSLTPKLFGELRLQCPNLVCLTLENVTFIGFNVMPNHLLKFPPRLELLDLRYSNGDEEAFVLISSNVKQLKCFGVTNHMMLHVNEVQLFQNLNRVNVLDFSYCNALFDATLLLVGTFCTQLYSLSLSHCNNVSGNGLDLIVQNCKNLKSLSFSGTSLTDQNLSNCNWGNLQLEELDVSWCRNITENGLMALLPKLNHLVYLRLCSCGFGHAITDRVLATLSNNSYPKLEILDVSYSREISDIGTAKLICSLPALKQIRLSCCRKLTVDLVSQATSNKHVLILASFGESSEHAQTTQAGILSVVRDMERASTLSDIRRYSFERHMLTYNY